MTELKKNKVPTLFNENYTTVPLNTLKRTKNDFIDRKTVWQIAIFSFLLGTLISLFLLWYSSKQTVNSEGVHIKNSVPHQLTVENTKEPDSALNGYNPVVTDGLKNQSGSIDQAHANLSVNQPTPNELDPPTKPSASVASGNDAALTKAKTDETMVNSHSNAYSKSQSNDQLKHQSKTHAEHRVKNSTTNRITEVKPKQGIINADGIKANSAQAIKKPAANPKAGTKPTASRPDRATNQAKTINSNKVNKTTKPKVDVIEQWINTHLKDQANHNPFKVLEQDASTAQSAAHKNSKSKRKSDAD